MIRSHFITQLLELIGTEILRSHIDEVALCRMTMLPIDCITRLIDEPLQLAHRLSQPGRVEFFADDPVSPFVLLQQRRCKAEIAEPAAAIPANGLCDAAGV